jgi:hypothetical protein
MAMCGTTRGFGPGWKRRGLSVDGRTVFEHACKLGLEGIVSKRRDMYRRGRSRAWLKIKTGEPGRDADHGWQLLMVAVFDPVDRSLLQRHLARVEQRIGESEKIIARQNAIAAQQEGAGFRTKTARELIAQFEQLLAMQIADRDRLRREIGSYNVV